MRNSPVTKASIFSGLLIAGFSPGCDSPVTPIEVAAVVVSVPRASIRAGEIVQAEARVTDAAGTAITGRTVTWTSSSHAIADVSAQGVITAKSPGAATVTATIDGKTGSKEITVSSVPVASIVLNPADTVLSIGGTLQMRAQTLDSAGRTLPNRILVWQVTEPTVAAVSDSGIVSALSLGTVQVMATSEGQSTSSRIEVDRVPLATAGRTLLFSSKSGFTGPVDILVAREDGSDAVNLTADSHGANEPSWSIDGKWIVFTSYNSGNADLYTMRDDGTRLRRITTAPEPETQGRWSPDGRKIVFTREGTPFPGSNIRLSEILIMNADGTGVTNLTNTQDISERDAAWSPDGTKVAFKRGQFVFDRACAGCPLFAQSTSVKLYVMNPDGTNQIPFADLPPDYLPDAISWAPDGRRIAVGAYDAKNSSSEREIWVIFVADADGSHPRLLTEGRFPSWSPDATRLLFSWSCCERWGEVGPRLGIIGADGTDRKFLPFDANRTSAEAASPNAWRR